MQSPADTFHATTGSSWYLTADAPDLLTRYLTEKAFLSEGESITEVVSAGEGNMNIALKVSTDMRTFVVKQSRPWVARFPDIPAPIGRIGVEHAYLQATAGVTALSSRQPQVLYYDADNYVLILEYLAEAVDMSYLYRAIKPLTMSAVNGLADYLSHLHKIPAGDFPVNRDLRALNHAHIFELPFQPDNGFPLDDILPGLGALAKPYQHDEVLRAAAAKLGEVYLSDGPVLVHGDFYPGSFMQREAGVFVIDGEFAHPGRPEFDVGVIAAHLQLAGLPWTDFVYRHYQKAPDFDHLLIHRFRAVEIMRRLIGIAQLPVALSLEERAGLLAQSREMLVNDNPGRPM